MMKKFLTLLAVVLFAMVGWAQTGGCPQKISYQAVIRNADNELVPNTSGIKVRISVLEAGVTTYSELHDVTSNQNGLVALIVGEDGTDITGVMDSVNWAGASFKTEVLVPGENWVSAETPITAVPYALYACEINPDGIVVKRIFKRLDKLEGDEVLIIQELTKLGDDVTHLQIDTVNMLKKLIKNVDLSGLRDSVKTNIKNIQSLKDSIEHNYVSNDFLKDTLSKYEIRNCTDVITCVDNAIENATSTTNLAIDTIVENHLHEYDNELCSKVMACTDIQTMRDSIQILIDSIDKVHDEIASTIHDSIINNISTQIRDSILANAPTIPTVNNATLTIQKNGTNVTTFTANASSNATANIVVNNDSLTIKFNGEQVGSKFSADAASAVTINILDKQLSKKYSATAGQTSFTNLTVPTGYSSINTTSRIAQLYINGVYVGDTVDGVLSISGTTATYNKTNNDNYDLVAADRVQIVYWVK